jgi:transcriptional regulator with XRE-family HTH domain
MTTIQKGFGQRVFAIRQASGLGKEAFARRVLSEGASAKNIGRIEDEEVIPRQSTLQKISQFGNVDLNWLTTGQCVLKPNDLVTTIGVAERISAARQAAGLSRLALAKASELGSSSKNIQRLEAGQHRPTFRTVTKIAKALKMSATDIAYGA